MYWYLFGLYKIVDKVYVNLFYCVKILIVSIDKNKGKWFIIMNDSFLESLFD